MEAKGEGEKKLQNHFLMLLLRMLKKNESRSEGKINSFDRSHK
jgi:hypothetical protein